MTKFLVDWQYRNTSFSILVNEFLGRFLCRDRYKKQETRFFLICITYKSNFYEFLETKNPEIQMK